MNRLALVATVLLASSAASARADSRPADCELTVRGRTYIRGTCQFSPLPGGSFQISGNDYFAYVNLTAPGTAEASWNANPASTHAQTPLGQVTRDGACWAGPSVRICARALAPAAQAAATAAQPDGQALFPEIASQACLRAEPALQAGANLVLHNCRVPADLIFVRRADGSLGLSRHPELCLGLEAPGMGRQPVPLLEPCRPGAPSWTTRATSTAAAVVQSSAGLCLTIPQMATPEARFPYTVQAVPCAQAGDAAVKFLLSRG